MEIFLIEIQSYNDGTKTSKAIYTYASLNEAISSYHSKMGAAMKLKNLKREVIIVLDEDGIYKHDTFYNEVIEEDVEE